MFSNDDRTSRGEPGWVYRDIDGFDELLGAVKDEPRAREKLGVHDYRSENDQFVLLTAEVAQVPITIAAAHLSAAASEGQELEELYSRCEQYLIGSSDESIRGDIVIPILGANLTPSDFDDQGLSVIKLDDAVSIDRRDYSKRVESWDLPRITQASCALLLKNRAIRVEGFGDTQFSYPGEAATEEIEIFFEVLSIECPGPVNWVEVAIRSIDWMASLRTMAGDAIGTLQRDYQATLDRMGRVESRSYELDSESLNHVVSYMGKIRETHKGVRVAATRLFLASTRLTDPDRVIDLCIGLEALLGSGFSETVHRLSLRAAALISQVWGGSSSAIYAATRDLYSYRSRVVHGEPGPHKKDLLTIEGTPIHATRFATAALVSTLRFALTHPNFNPDRLDEELVFSAFDFKARQLREERDHKD